MEKSTDVKLRKLEDIPGEDSEFPLASGGFAVEPVILLGEL
ncbi:hypothetical protein [Desulfovibrio cuneatus]|nr:hypothetical protein [Desulfovibrio cuneatus]